MQFLLCGNRLDILVLRDRFGCALDVQNGPPVNFRILAVEVRLGRVAEIRRHAHQIDRLASKRHCPVRRSGTRTAAVDEGGGVLECAYAPQYIVRALAGLFAGKDYRLCHLKPLDLIPPHFLVEIDQDGRIVSPQNPICADGKEAVQAGQIFRQMGTVT